MLEIRERCDHAHGELRLTLPFEARQRSRALVRLSSGQEVALLLPRGSVLRGGDALKLSDGRTLWVEAAPETVSTVHSDDAQALARVAYHLGNRHVPLEVGRGFVRYAHDHVLDAMVRELGLRVLVEEAPFEPEGGAYGRGGQHHRAEGHSHSHSHDLAHAHDHEDEDEHDNAHVHVHANEDAER